MASAADHLACVLPSAHCVFNLWLALGDGIWDATQKLPRGRPPRIHRIHHTIYWPHSCATEHPTEKLRRGFASVMQEANILADYAKEEEEKLSGPKKLVAWGRGSQLFLRLSLAARQACTSRLTYSYLATDHSSKQNIRCSVAAPYQNI